MNNIWKWLFFIIMLILFGIVLNDVRNYNIERENREINNNSKISEVYKELSFERLNKNDYIDFRKYYDSSSRYKSIVDSLKLK